MKNNALAYSLKVWITAAFFGSIILVAYLSESSKQFIDKISIIGIATVMAAIFSIPGILVFLLSSLGLCNMHLSNITRKTILTGAGILSNLIAYLAGLWFGSIGISMIVPYAIISISSIWFYKLKTDKHEPAESII